MCIRDRLNSLLIYETNFKNTGKILLGSWAGAMGQGQFMPSSFLNYAVDYDKDKIVDIWNSHYDIFASIANYLKSHGWKKQNYWSVEMQVKKDFKETIQENSNYNIINSLKSQFDPLFIQSFFPRIYFLIHVFDDLFL